MQNDRKRESSQRVRLETPSVHAIRDDSPLLYPGRNSVVNGQLEHGLMLHACAMTEEGKQLLHSRFGQEVAVMNQDGSGSSAAGTPDDGSINNVGEPPDSQEELSSDEAFEFGEKLCQKKAADWATAQLKGTTASVVIEYILQDTPSSEINEEGSDPRVDVLEVKRLVSQGKLMELPNSKKLLVRRPSRAPTNRPDRNPGCYERFIGDEPVRTYVPLLLRSWVMYCAHKEAVHLGEKVTLGLLQ